MNTKTNIGPISQQEMEQQSKLHSTIANTHIQLGRGAGTVSFEQRTLWFFQPAVAWLRLQELYRRSRGQVKGFTFATAQQLTPNEATKQFHIALGSVLGQFAVMTDVGRQSLFESLLQSIEHTKSFDGLESVFLTGLNSMDLMGKTDLVSQGLALWDQIGIAIPSNEGSTLTPFLDTSTNTASFLGSSTLSSLGPQGANRAVLSQGSGFGLGIQSLADGDGDGGGTGGNEPSGGMEPSGGNPPPDDSGTAPSGGNQPSGGNEPPGGGGSGGDAQDSLIVTIFQAAGTLIGAIVGLIGGGVAGGLAGAKIGGAIGKEVGGLILGAITGGGGGGGGDKLLPADDGTSGPLTAGGVGVISSTYPTGSGVASYIGQTRSGSFIIQGMPQLAISNARLQLSHPGILAALPTVVSAFSVSSQLGANALGKANNLASGLSGIGQQEAFHQLGEGIA